ncbi:MAG: hypothetical protein WCX65_00385 [bacterium]
MAAKQISIFGDETAAPATPPLSNKRLFSDIVFDREMKKWREWRRAPETSDALCGALDDAAKNGRTGMALDALGLRAIRETGGCIVLANSQEKSKPVLLRAADPNSVSERCRLISTLESESIDWGIITDGAKWRLLRRGLPGGVDRFLEADSSALSGASADMLKTFSLIFGGALFSDKETFADAAFRASAARTASLRDSLRSSARSASELLAKGFISTERQTTGAVPGEEALEMIYKHSLVIVQRLIFAFCAESAGIFPASEKKYSKEIGMSSIIASSAAVRSSKKAGADFRFTLWEALERFSRAAHHGDEEFKMPCQGGALFDPERHPFLTRNSVPDSYIAEAVGLLALKGGPDALPGGGYAEIDAADITEALAPLALLRARLAVSTLSLVNDEGVERWLPKSQAKWKKTIAQVKKGDFYLDDTGAALLYNPPRATLAEYVSGAFSGKQFRDGFIFIPETGAGVLPLTVIDAAARSMAIAGDMANLSLADIQREAAQTVFALDPNQLNVEFARLGVWLLTICASPPIPLEHNIQTGSALCGISANDIAALPAGSKITASELSSWAKELRDIRSRVRSGLAGVRSRESGFQKIEKKITAALKTPEIRAAAETGPDNADSNQIPVIHPPLSFPEVFFNEKRSGGFSMIFAAPEPKHALAADEIASLRKRLNLRGTLSAPDAAARRHSEFLAPGGALALFAPARFLKTARARSLMNGGRNLPGLSGISTRTEKLSAGFVLLEIRID